MDRKCPRQLASMHVPRAHIARGPVWRILLRHAARNREVLIDGRRRTESVAPRQALQNFRRVQVRDAVVAESMVRLPGLGIERIKFAVARSENDLRAVSCCRRASIQLRAWKERRSGAGTTRFLFLWSGPERYTREYGVRCTSRR